MVLATSILEPQVCALYGIMITAKTLYQSVMWSSRYMTDRRNLCPLQQYLNIGKKMWNYESKKLEYFHP